MKRILLILLCASVVTSLPAADLPAQPLGSKDKLIFSDDFERTELGPKLKSPIPAFTVADGVLKGRQQRDDHGATVGATLPLPDGNLILEVRFRLQTARSISIGCDDKNWKGTHAGHISRLTIKPNGITLMDDKEGVMRNDIYALRKSGDAAKKSEGDRLAASATADVPVKIKPDAWHQLGLEIVGDQMRVTLDGQPIGHLKSPGLAHATKPDLRISAWGKDQEAQLDDLRIWTVKAAAKAPAAKRAATSLLNDAFLLPLADAPKLEALSLPKAARAVLALNACN